MSNFTKLINPCSDNYKQLKNVLLSHVVPWYFFPKTTPKTIDYDNYVNAPYYGHTLLERPKWENQEMLFPQQKSDLLNNFNTVLQEIITCNSLEFNCLLRVNANCVHPQQSVQTTIPHYDHQFPHTNLIMYLTDAGGETIVFDKENNKELFNPSEDDIVIFKGLHCMNTPKTKPRTILIATYI